MKNSRRPRARYFDKFTIGIFKAYLYSYKGRGNQFLPIATAQVPV